MKRVGFFSWIGIAAAQVGCASFNARMTVESGPPTGQRNGIAIYAVHIGERPRVVFEAKLGACDYAIAHVEGTEQYEDCGPPIVGRFEWKQDFGEASATNEPLRLTVKAYQQDGKRDFMPVGGKLVEAQRKHDGSDILIASQTVVIDYYQSELVVTVPAAKSPPDWTLSRLTIRKGGEAPRRIGYSARSNGPGFTAKEEGPAGGWVVRYRPQADEVNREGQTGAELIVADQQGGTRRFAISFATP